MIDDTALISLVQNCPCLYDKNSIEFRDNNKKNASWQAIANVLKVSGKEICTLFRGFLFLIYSSGGARALEKNV